MLPEGDSLKNEPRGFGSVIYGPMYNLQLDSRFYSDDFHYADLDLMVKFPIFFKDANLIAEEDLSIQLGKINGKVIVCNHGLIRVQGGNHRVKHFFHKPFYRESSSIKVLHYPIRSKSRFIDHIENRVGLLQKNERIKMGDHYRRWVKLHREGRLNEEFERIILNDEDIKVLTKFGVIERAGHISERMNKLLNRDPAKGDIENNQVFI